MYFDIMKIHFIAIIRPLTAYCRKSWNLKKEKELFFYEIMHQNQDHRPSVRSCLYACALYVANLNIATSRRKLFSPKQRDGFRKKKRLLLSIVIRPLKWLLRVKDVGIGDQGRQGSGGGKGGWGVKITSSGFTSSSGPVVKIDESK